MNGCNFVSCKAAITRRNKLCLCRDEIGKLITVSTDITGVSYKWYASVLAGLPNLYSVIDG